MFIGEYQHNLDNKGRIFIPFKFRALLKSGCVATKGLDQCLFLYTKTSWEKMAKKIAALPIDNAADRAMARSFLAGASALSFDNQGRVTLPEYLRDFAGLKIEAIIAGLYDRLEIWDKQQWQQYQEVTEKYSNSRFTRQLAGE